MIRRFNTPEILAPCGSYDILVAAVKAGADACYIGGSRFGARAYAGNLDTDSIVKAIDYAHLHGVKLYLTVNTLFKNTEIKELKNYLLPYYEAGIDAVIVQDLGAFSLIKHIFPDMNIHCSTQMNINSVYGAELMKKHGATRVVTAREMTLEEIRAIKENVDIEVETFVHGAMCYSYSGQCLLSSVAGERSGNRGRCAQPCRKCYDDSYILSMKDMCAILHLPDIIEAGIDSLKIEGRMKNEYYVASAVNAYKEMRDDYLQGRYDIKKAGAMKERLANIFNRGGFSDGYFYFEKPSSLQDDMISRNRPNNQGVLIGKAVGVKDGRIKISLCNDLYQGDVIEVLLKDKSTIDVTVASSAVKESTVYVAAPKTRQIALNKDIYRTRCKKIIDDIEDNILSSPDNYSKLHISGAYKAHIGETSSLSLRIHGIGFENEVTVYGDEIGKAEKEGTRHESVIAKISQLGTTDYIMDKLEADISEGAFIPAGGVKKLRRAAISELEKAVASMYRRTFVDKAYSDMSGEAGALSDKPECMRDGKDKPYINVHVTTINQLSEVIKYDYVAAIYMDKILYDQIKDTHISDIRNKGIKIYLNMPYIIESRFSIDEYLPNDGIDGIYIRNIDALAIVVKYKLYEKLSCICAASMYGYNNLARGFIADNCPGITFELPKELTLKEMQDLNVGLSEFNIYGYQQVMLSAQCVRRNKYGCNHDYEVVSITDDKSNKFLCKSVCDECCNVIYNGIPFSMIYKTEDMYKYINPDYIGVSFTVEDEKAAGDIMELIGAHIVHDTIKKQNSDKMFTTGHCFRGVE